MNLCSGYFAAHYDKWMNCGTIGNSGKFGKLGKKEIEMSHRFISSYANRPMLTLKHSPCRLLLKQMYVIFRTTQKVIKEGGKLNGVAPNLRGRPQPTPTATATPATAPGASSDGFWVGMW